MPTLRESLIDQYETVVECATNCLDEGSLMDGALDHMMAYALASALAGADDAAPVWAERAAAHYGQACLVRLNHKRAIENAVLDEHKAEHRCTARRKSV